MQLTHNFRRNFPRTVRNRFTRYWHAMHPVDFSRKKMYRAGFTDAEWDALNLLKDRRSDCVNSNDYFHYKDDRFGVDMRMDMPKKYEGFPFIRLSGEQLDPATRTHLSDWYHKAKEWDDLHSRSYQYVYQLLDTDVQKKSLYGVNTIRQLYAIWPELLPCFNEVHRSVCRETKVRPKLPVDWNTEDVSTWMSKPRMDELNHALTVMTLIPDKVDKNYPSLR